MVLLQSSADSNKDDGKVWRRVLLEHFVHSPEKDGREPLTGREMIAFVHITMEPRATLEGRVAEALVAQLMARTNAPRLIIEPANNTIVFVETT